MQMQKKITVKDDGRFLTYYHFPVTATQEETAVFDAIQEAAGNMSASGHPEQGAEAVAQAVAIENPGGPSHV